jgi:hypothetical protein
LQELIIHSFIKPLSRLSLHFSFDTSIGRHFVSFLTCISCFYIYLVKYFNLNEKFILLKDSSDRIGLEYFITTRIGFGLDNFGSDSFRIINIQSDPMHTSSKLFESLIKSCVVASWSPLTTLAFQAGRPGFNRWSDLCSRS